MCLIFRFIYETEHFNGVAELLEILGRFVSNHTDALKGKLWPSGGKDALFYVTS